MTVKWKTEEDRTITGRVMEKAFSYWVEEVTKTQSINDYGRTWGMVDLVARWMTETSMGALALERLNRFPKQRRLPLPDDSCPWEVVE